MLQAYLSSSVGEGSWRFSGTGVPGLFTAAPGLFTAATSVPLPEPPFGSMWRSAVRDRDSLAGGEDGKGSGAEVRDR